MFLLVWLRTVITVQDVSYDYLSGLKAPIYPGLVYETGKGNWTYGDAQTSYRMKEFMVYDNYSFVGEDDQFTIATDFAGPLYFNPPNCLEGAYPNIPQRPTPGIAMVGDTDSRVMQKMKDYLYTLNAWQEDLPSVLRLLYYKLRVSVFLQ